VGSELGLNDLLGVLVGFDSVARAGVARGRSAPMGGLVEETLGGEGNSWKELGTHLSVQRPPLTLSAEAFPAEGFAGAKLMKRSSILYGVDGGKVRSRRLWVGVDLQFGISIGFKSGSEFPLNPNCPSLSFSLSPCLQPVSLFIGQLRTPSSLQTTSLSLLFSSFEPPSFHRSDPLAASAQLAPALRPRAR
jgi:hypothetical protein